MEKSLQRNTFIKLNRLAFSMVLMLMMIACDSMEYKFLSPNIVISNTQGTTLFVADETANRITLVDLVTHELTHVSINGIPRGLALSKDERKLYVTAGDYQGKLLEINLITNTVEREIIAGHTPMSPVLSGTGKVLYFCNRFENQVCKFDLASFKIVSKAKADREPVSLAFSNKNDRLYVANHLPRGDATGKYFSSKISVIDASSLRILKQISLPNGSNALNDISLSGDEKFAYITHILARYNVPTNQVERGWINTNAMSILDLTSDDLLCSVLLDDPDRGAANPYGVVCTRDDKHILVSHQGTDEVSIIDREELHARIKAVENENPKTWYAENPDQIQNDLSFLQDIRKRVSLNGKGAKGLSVKNDEAFVSLYFTGEIACINITDGVTRNNIALGDQAQPTEERLGEMYFNDATLCKQNWQSCTSCHPGNGRVDGLNWDNLNDDIGNPKNTKSMLLAHKTPPAMITGVRANAEGAVRAGIEHILFTLQPDEIAEAMDAYLISLEPVKSPYLVNHKLSEAALRGMKHFENTGCNHCHSGPLYTDLQKYDVGTGTGTEVGKKFDTPTLIEIWRTGPYLYNGKAMDLHEVLTVYNTGQKHGETAKLKEQEMNDLVEYLLSL